MNKTTVFERIRNYVSPLLTVITALEQGKEVPQKLLTQARISVDKLLTLLVRIKPVIDEPQIYKDSIRTLTQLEQYLKEERLSTIQARTFADLKIRLEVLLMVLDTIESG